jgi:DNA-binding transcriptional LysR family regulator
VLAAVSKRWRFVQTLAQFYGLELAVPKGPPLAAVPREFAGELQLGVYLPPFDVPVPELSLYWHRRHDQDRARRWLRGLIVAGVREFP